MSEQNQGNRIRKDGTSWKERVVVEDSVFFPQYKRAMDANVKLVDFAREVNLAPATIQQRIAKANKKLKLCGYTKRWKYLSNSTGATRGRKASTVEEIAKYLGD